MGLRVTLLYYTWYYLLKRKSMSVIFSIFLFYYAALLLVIISKTHTGWKSILKCCMDSIHSLIKFSISATNFSSNIKTIFKLPHVTKNFVISFCTGLSDPQTKQEFIMLLGECYRTFVKTVPALYQDTLCHATLTWNAFSGPDAILRYWRK
jgi:hypothetical protein